MSVTQVCIKMDKEKRDLLEQIAKNNCRKLSQEINYALNLYLNYVQGGQVMLAPQMTLFSVDPKVTADNNKTTEHTLSLNDFNCDEVEEF